MRCKQKMTAEYSAHPAVASNIHNTSLSSLTTSSHQNCNSIPASSHPAHYQHYKKFSTITTPITVTDIQKTCNKEKKTSATDCCSSGNDTVDSSKPNLPTIPSSENLSTINADSIATTLPDRTINPLGEILNDHNPHHLSFNPHNPHQCSSHHPHQQHSCCIGKNHNNKINIDSSNTSGSSNESTPSQSTLSSPLSTPTRLAPHCCQMTSAGAAAAAQAAAVAAATAAAAAAAAAASTTTSIAGCKKSTKFDPRLGPSPYRQLLPIALFILSFATVFSILIVYMDTTEIRHQQFRLNMSRDYELFGVAQDDPTLIAFLREIHMKKYPMHFLKKTSEEHLNFTEHHELTPKMAHYVADLVGGKLNGAVIQSLPGQMGNLMTAPWLAETLNWAGVIIEPEPRRYFTLRKQNAHRSKMQVVHACVSPNKHPKEVTIHNEESEVRINSLLDEETSWFNSRVKCFPLYTIMLASNRIDFDLLSLGVHGRELEILQTLPYNVVNIEVISIHLPEDHENVRGYIQSVTKFLMGKSYKLQKTFGRNYFYQKLNTNRTRKKDIFTKKP